MKVPAMEKRNRPRTMLIDLKMPVRLEVVGREDETTIASVMLTDASFRQRAADDPKTVRAHEGLTRFCWERALFFADFGRERLFLDRLPGLAYSCNHCRLEFCVELPVLRPLELVRIPVDTDATPGRRLQWGSRAEERPGLG